VALAHAALEHGDVVFCPELRFTVEPNERALFTPAILGSAKNASYDPAADRLGGTTGTGAERQALQRLMQRFSQAQPRASTSCCRRTADRWFARARAFDRGDRGTRHDVAEGRHPIARRQLSGHALGRPPILRVFTNVNPEGRPRSWRIGDDFDAVARRFADRLRLPLPGLGVLLALVRVTKTRARRTTRSCSSCTT
jgi:hypothetical protein